MPNAWRSLGAGSLSLWDRTIVGFGIPWTSLGGWEEKRGLCSITSISLTHLCKHRLLGPWPWTHQAPQQWWAENSIYAHASTSSKKADLRLLLSHSRSFFLYALDFPTQKPPSLEIKRTGYPVKGSEGREAKFPMDRDQQEAERAHRKPGELPTISLLLPRLTRQHK